MMRAMATLRVRPMTLLDCAELKTVFSEVPGNLDPQEELRRELTRSWVACDGNSDRPLGYALGWWVVDELQLLALATLPAARRRGVARRLLSELIAAARAAGAERVTLEVARGNSAARALYASFGFREFNVRKAYYRATGEDALELELGL
jgi:[ribosomal protein S18]-alanine N-acetyltransferase